MNTFPIADGVDVLVTDARFFDVDTTLLLTRGLLRFGQRECAIALRSPH